MARFLDKLAANMDEIMMDPEAHGYKVCGHCNGYGSSLQESSPSCSKCGGCGVVKKEAR